MSGPFSLFLFRFCIYDMLSAIVMVFPIRIIQLIYTDTLAGGSMDKLPAAEIYTAVGSTLRIGLEKDEVPWNKLISISGLKTKLKLKISSPWECIAVLGKNILQVSRAVKALRGSATKFIWCTNIFSSS